jgi:hypothetical protein
MPVSFRHKFKFIHIPKTGGSSIEKIYDLQHTENLFIPKVTHCVAGCWFAPQHFTQRMIDIFKPESSDWFSFTIVRNPYTKIISEYYYVNKVQNTPVKTFNEKDFLHWFENDLLKFNLDHKLPQYFFLDSPVNMILRFEELEDDFHKLNIRLGTTKTLIHDNKSSIDKNSIAKGLSTATKKIIYANFRKDFEAFGYVF